MAAIIEKLSDSRAEAREWELRCDMAAVFRIGARLGWNEHIGNHNSLMLPDEAEPRFLINPRGYLFQELKASDLIVCDLEGRVLRGAGELRKVAFHIHTRIHLANPAAAFAALRGAVEFLVSRMCQQCGRDGLEREIFRSPAETDEGVSLIGAGDFGDDAVGAFVELDRLDARTIEEWLAIEA